MNPKTDDDAIWLAGDIGVGLLSFDFSKVQVAICPSFIHMKIVEDALSNQDIELGAQDFFANPCGPFTGAVSIEQLESLVTFSLVGHSERRIHFNETDEEVNKKLLVLERESRIVPVLCVGEYKQIRRRKKHLSYVHDQLNYCLDGAEDNKLIVAYEPVWAIGAKEPAKVSEISEMISAIREYFDSYDLPVSVLYGGSVDEKNAGALLKSGCDGFLVGGASLRADAFVKICQATLSSIA